MHAGDVDYLHSCVCASLKCSHSFETQCSTVHSEVAQPKPYSHTLGELFKGNEVLYFI